MGHCYLKYSCKHFIYWFFSSFSGPPKTFSNISLRWNPGTLHPSITGCGSITMAIWDFGISCLLLSYVVNFPLAWLSFKGNRRNSNLVFLSVSPVMVFAWGYYTLHYSFLTLRGPGRIIFIFLMSGSGRLRNVNAC